LEVSTTNTQYDHVGQEQRQMGSFKTICVRYSHRTAEHVSM
jgi:hypothetical protein